MNTTPKSMRVQIGIFGRTNVGKSSVLNMIANQDVAMTSPVPGTTTDVVEKSMELLPIGPVVFLDTAGIDDVSELAELRIERTGKILDRADVVILVTEPGVWGDYEKSLSDKLKERKIPFIIVVNKIDLADVSELESFCSSLPATCVKCEATKQSLQDKHLTDIKTALLSILPDDMVKTTPLLSDLLPKGGICVMIVPIDLQAPKGRLILPQVQAIRDALDGSTICIVVKETEYKQTLSVLTKKPDLVICDSQVVDRMVAETPSDVKCTTFSILLARAKGDLVEEARGAAMLDFVKPGDKILIAEACSHHPTEDDIGRVKIPRWLKKYLGDGVEIDIASGRDFPENLTEYKLIIHCGGCMLTRNEKLVRVEKAKKAGVAITNYGIAISKMQGVLARALSPFEKAMEEYKRAEKEWKN